MVSRFLHKIHADETEQLVIVVLTWHTQVWYPKLLEMFIAPIPFSFQSKRIFSKILQATYTHLWWKIQYDFQPENISETLCFSGDSRTSSKLITEAKWETACSYELAWTKWVGWFSEKQIDPIHFAVYHILSLSGQLYQAGYEYRTICLYRSSISTYHNRAQGSKIGFHPKVSKLIKEVFNARPPK